MSKKNNRRSNRSLQNGKRVKEVKPLDGATILNRFHALESQKGGSPSPGDIVGFISIENASAVCILGAFPKKQPQLEKECAEFVNYFVEKYVENQRVMRAIGENWGDNGPLILRIGMTVLSESDDFPYDQEVELTELQKSLRDQLVNYIFSHNSDKTLTFTIDNPSGGITQEQFVFPAHLSPKDDAEVRGLTGDWIGWAFAFAPGGVTLRIHGKGAGGKDILNGFRITKDAIARISAKEMCWAQETMPDGSRQPDPSADYQTPTVIFASFEA